jgi:hypothetical protein
MERIELQTIQNGAVIEMFDEELRKVLANIQDENTVPNQERSITIKIAIKPDKTRRTGEIKVQTSSALAKVKPTESLLFFDKDESGAFVALEDDPGPMLPGMEKPESNDKIKPFPKAANGG